MNLIVKSNDESYFYLYKLLHNKYKYTDSINTDVNNLVFNKCDNFGYIKDTTINIENILKHNKINKIFVEEETIYLNKLLSKYKTKCIVLNKNSLYIKEIDKLKSVILLKYILDENKQSIYNLNFLILGDNDLSNEIKRVLSSLVKYDTYTIDVLTLSLDKYDVVINTTDIKISEEILFDVKKSLIIYDLYSNSKIDRKLLYNTYIKYRYISNVSLYLPIAKASIIKEVMCEYESI